jgi:hypothetical protein
MLVMDNESCIYLHFIVIVSGFDGHFLFSDLSISLSVASNNMCPRVYGYRVVEEP